MTKKLPIKLNKPKFKIGSKAKLNRDYGYGNNGPGKILEVRAHANYEYLYETKDGTRRWVNEYSFVGGKSR